MRDNRPTIELMVFFGWAASLKGTAVGLKVNSALRFPERPRSRILSDQKLEWFLQALPDEPKFFQRGFFQLLLTTARISALIEARCDEVVNGV